MCARLACHCFCCRFECAHLRSNLLHFNSCFANCVCIAYSRDYIYIGKLHMYTTQLCCFRWCCCGCCCCRCCIMYVSVARPTLNTIGLPLVFNITPETWFLSLTNTLNLFLCDNCERVAPTTSEASKSAHF